MTDRELLELAAKAAGIKHNPSLSAACRGERAFWNPLTDDGHALRLAVKLGMSIEVHHDDSQPKPWLRVVFAGGRWEHATVKDYAHDPYAATRRAIVRAAAEFGKAMKGGQHAE